MNTGIALSRRVRHAVTCVLSVALAACSSETTKPVSPLAPPPVQTTYVATYDCAVDQTELPVIECQALVDLYTSTDGAAWTNNTGWLQNATPCSWYGIACFGSGSVLYIQLAFNNLTGAIPSSLGSLTNLLWLDLFVNQLSGAIPVSLGSLTNLQALFLSSNQLSGAIPESLGRLRNLLYMSLQVNRLSGAIPRSLGSLTSLQQLSLDQNQLSGAIPASLGGLTNLQYLGLAFNSLTGNLPSSLTNLTSVAYLDLTANRLSGRIPLSVAQYLGVVESRTVCSLMGNAGLLLGGGPRYRAADLNMDGFICALQLPTAP